MTGIGDYLKEKSGLNNAAKSLQDAKEDMKAATAPAPPPTPNEPAPPKDLKHAIAAGLKNANQGAQAINSAAQALSSATSVLSTVADPGAAIAGALGGAADEKMSKLVSGLAAAMGPFPAATLTGLALGIPHAHIKHPPSGPPPIPPIPLPPLGPVMLGTNLTVLINNKPTARCGDYGLNPTCCGVVPPLSALFEIVTGSSSVYIGGSRAARANIDITMHCFHVPSPKMTVKVGKLAGIASKVGKVAGKVTAAAGKVAGAVGKVASVAGKVAQATQIASSFAEAEADDDAAMAAAIGLSVAMMAAQAAADAAAGALTKQIGTDQPFIPPVGTPGMILMGSPNVMIGGFPLPSFSAIAQGLLKRVKGLKFVSGGGGPKAGNTKPACEGGKPINFITGACFDNYIDYELPGPIPFRWARAYDSRWSSRPGPFGPGFRHFYQRELRRTIEGFEYTDQTGDIFHFPAFEAGEEFVTSQGFLLRNLDTSGIFVLEEMGECRMEFAPGDHNTPTPLQAVRDGDAEIRFYYDNDGRLTKIRDSQSRVVVVISDALGRIVQLRLSEHGEQEGRLLAAYTYSHAGDLVRFQDALGNSRTYAYDAAHRMTCNVDRRGYATFNEYDATGRCVHEYCADGLYDVSVEYLPESRCTIATYADGATSTYFYDENCIPTEIIERSGGKIRFERDNDGRVVKRIDPLGNITELLYNDWGGHVGRVNPLGYFLPPTYIDPNPPDPLSYTLPLNAREWEHGRLMERSQVKRPAYDDPVSSLYPANVSNPVLCPTPPVTTPHGRTVVVTAPAPSKTLDSLGRILEEVDDRGHVQRWKYDPEGNVVEHQDRDGSIHRFVYKSWNLLAEEISPTGGSTRFDYSIRAEVTRVIDANGTISEYVYDHWDRLIEVRRHGRVKERYRYDAADNLIEKTDGEGRALLTFKVVPGNLHGVRHLATGENHYFEYDERGRFTVAAADELEATFAHDALGRLLQDLRDGVGVEHAFSAGRLATTTYFGRFSVQYKNTGGQLTITDPTGAVHRVQFSDRGLISRELSNGRTELARYDGDGRCLHKVGTERFHDGIRWRNVFAYSAEGDLLEADHSGVRMRYAYDASHRLRQETLPDGTERKFEHDPGGNLVLQPGLTDVVMQEGNRLGSANGDRFAYNDRNHISSRQGPSGTVRYEYNAIDMLTSVEMNGERWTAEYDPLGRRVTKTWRGKSTRYYWDDFRLAAEVRHDGTLRLYVYEDEAALVPLLFVEYETLDAKPETGKRYFVFTNQIGVPVRMEDDRGQTVWRAQIDPFGLAHVSPDSTIDMPLRFPGHYFDKETELHYNRFRYYDPRLGRYLQSDPYGMAGGINLYAYCPNPLTMVDLDGLTHPSQTGPGQKGKGKDGPNNEAGARDASGRRRGPDGRFLPEKKPDYSSIPDPQGGVTVGGDFTARQKKAAIELNRQHNGGVVRSDGDGRPLEKAEKSKEGVTPSPNEVQIDHKIPKDKGGTNASSNIAVLSREENREKSNK
jgi:RHS repeat-associated protein